MDDKRRGTRVAVGQAVRLSSHTKLHDAPRHRPMRVAAVAGASGTVLCTALGIGFSPALGPALCTILGAGFRPALGLALGTVLGTALVLAASDGCSSALGAGSGERQLFRSALRSRGWAPAHPQPQSATARQLA